MAVGMKGLCNGCKYNHLLFGATDNGIKIVDGSEIFCGLDYSYCFKKNFTDAAKSNRIRRSLIAFKTVNNAKR